MIYKPLSSFSCEFITTNPLTGTAQNADSLPVAIAVRNGNDDASFPLTVTNIDTGRYKVTGTVPSSYSAGDRVQIVVSATISGISGKAIIDNFQIDTKYESDTYADMAKDSTVAKEATLNTKASQSSVDAIKAKTDQLNFVATDVKATLDGETVTASSVTDKTGYSLSSASEDSIVSKIWSATIRTLTDVSSIASAVWNYATRKLTSRNISTGDDIASEQMLSSLISGAISPGVLQSHYTVTGDTITIIRGDVVNLTFNLTSAWNLTNKKAYFIAKKTKTADNSKAIVNRECTITDPNNGICTITLTEAETAKGGDYYAEIEIRNTDDTNPQTAKQFILSIEQDVRQ